MAVRDKEPLPKPFTDNLISFFRDTTLCLYCTLGQCISHVSDISFIKKKFLDPILG